MANFFCFIRSWSELNYGDKMLSRRHMLWQCISALFFFNGTKQTELSVFFLHKTWFICHKVWMVIYLMWCRLAILNTVFWISVIPYENYTYYYTQPIIGYKQIFWIKKFMYYTTNMFLAIKITKLSFTILSTSTINK